MSEPMDVVLAVDQGTSSTRVIAFDVNARAVDQEQLEIASIFPMPGWVEQDPLVILESAQRCLDAIMARNHHFHVVAIGITNQRETTIMWDKITGHPLCNAIVWLDTRTSGTCDEVTKTVGSGDRNYFRDICGLPITTYFSAMKMKWMLDNVTGVKEAAEKGHCLFGTVDTWLIWNLTGGVNSGVHVTDVTNASRTMLMSLKTLQWDEKTCKELNIPMSMLPKIASSSQVYGHVAQGSAKGVPIAGCLGDQQAAMVGQQCFKKGEAKNTYGTGCFLLYNTGTEVVPSKHGMLSTVCYQLGEQSGPVYALEGSVAIAGAAVQWLRDNLGIIQQASDINKLAAEVTDNGGLYFVPAFGGLFAPYWRSDARGVMVGITQYITKNHLARAVLESVCYQTREVLDAMRQDSGVELKRLKVDGGMTSSEMVLQIQADLLEDVTVAKPDFTETTALGAAFAAGLAMGMWKSIESLPSVGATEFKGKIRKEEREAMMKGWKKAVERSFDLA